SSRLISPIYRSSSLSFIFFPSPLSLFICLTPLPTPFPYTTLFRSSLYALIGQGKPLLALVNDKNAVKVCFGFHKAGLDGVEADLDRKSTRLNSSHVSISYAVFCLNK